MLMNSRGGLPLGTTSMDLAVHTYSHIIQAYSVDSIKRTVHLAFHGLFSLLKILFTISKQYF
jgi:hypothetical protein